MRVYRPAAFAVIVVLVAAGCSHGAESGNPEESAPPARMQVPSPAPSRAVPSPKAAPTQAPRATSTPLPAPSASPAPPAPTATPTPVKAVPRLSPDAAPEILDVQVSETTVSPGDNVYGSVVTSSNVASVEARIGGYGMSLHKTGVGRFELAYKVGTLPWFVRGNFTMQVIARNARGDAVTRSIPLTVR